MWKFTGNHERLLIKQEKTEMSVLEEKYDIAIVGAGHAGCEAALACARLGLETIMFTVSGTALH